MSDIEEEIIDQGNEQGVDEVIKQEEQVVEQKTEAEIKADEETVKQEAINKAINKKHFETQQAKRELDTANKRIAEFESIERERTAAQVENIPPMPDPFDDYYNEKVKQRDEALIKQANFDSQNQTFQQQQQFQQQQDQQQKQVKLQESMNSYSKKATKLGIKQDELQSAANAVAQYGLSDDLVMHILADSDGPLITKYLAANPQDGIELAQMSPFMVGSFLDGIKQKTGELKPKITKTPNPGDNLKGKGAAPSDSKYKNISGAKFE